MHSSFEGPLSSSSESEDVSETLASPLASFCLSLLLSFCRLLAVELVAFEPFDSDPDCTDGVGIEEDVTGAPDSCNFFLIKSSADGELCTIEGLEATASRPPVVIAGAFRVTIPDPLSDNTLVFGTVVG